MNTLQTALTNAVAPKVPVSNPEDQKPLTLEEQVRMLTAMMAEMKEQNQDLSAQLLSARNGIRVRKVDDTPWHIRKFAHVYGPKSKRNGQKAFDVHPESIMVNGNVAIALHAGDPKFGVAILIMASKQRGIFLNAKSIGALVDDGSVLCKQFAARYHEQLAVAALSEPSESSEPSE